MENSGTTESEVAHDLQPFFRIYKDGRVERFLPTVLVPAGDDRRTGVRSKDVVISPENNVAARLFLPGNVGSDSKKLPVLIYIHGGAFSLGSAFSATYHHYLNNLVAEANVVAVSIEYRLAPEHPIPACYDDSWAVTKWVALHSEGTGPEPWLNDYADFGRVFFGGDSAGANLAHYMVVKASSADGDGGETKIQGLVLVHPFFGNDKPDRLWTFICPENSGLNDPRLNPAANKDLLDKLCCPRVLVCTAEKDFLRQRGWTYYEALKSSDWKGVVEIFETEGEEHVFHLFNPTCAKAKTLLKQVASFINSDHLSSL